MYMYIMQIQPPNGDAKELGGKKTKCPNRNLKRKKKQKKKLSAHKHILWLKKNTFFFKG